MKRIRVIPVLLLRNYGVYKSIKFKKHKYIGDPVNTIKIFNEKEVDEIVVLDIDASVNGTEPNYKFIEELASECFMPLGYGGGIRSFDQAAKLFTLGVEKVIINTTLGTNLSLLQEIADVYGSQSVVACMDVNKDLFGRVGVYGKSGKVKMSKDVTAFAKELEQSGAGELIVNAIYLDGTRAGFDLDLVKSVSDAVSIPVVACGGANNVDDVYAAVAQGNASAVAAGSMFVYTNSVDSILINYPTQQELKDAVYSKL